MFMRCKYALRFLKISSFISFVSFIILFDDLLSNYSVIIEIVV